MSRSRVIGAGVTDNNFETDLIYENGMFFKGYIKICEMATPIRNEILEM